MEEGKNTELLITRWEDQILSLQVKDGKILQVRGELEGESLLGNIYVGKVRNIVKNIHAAFVEFASGQMGYLSLDEKYPPLHTSGPGQADRVLIGDEILVQVAKEAMKTKPPTLTGALELPGRYVVLTVGQQQAGVSKKLGDKALRQRLAGVLGEYSCPEYGFIARTNSAQAEEEMLRWEMEQLIQQYRLLVTQGIHRTPFTCLYQAPAGYLCEIRDGNGEKIQQILTDDPQLYQSIREYLEASAPGELSRLALWDPARGKLDAVYNITSTLEHALAPKVWLKSGAYLVIQPTEALISIDVNTGKAISRKKDIQQTYRRVNREAAWEIGRQLRLRNLSGMILIDFIDMDSEEDRQELLQTLREAVAEDPVQTTVVDMTALGLVEVTRKKMRRPLQEQIRRRK